MWLASYFYPWPEVTSLPAHLKMIAPTERFMEAWYRGDPSDRRLV
jgi:hypothetical protein